MIVRLRKKEPSYPELSYSQYYVVIGIEADDYRLLNDQGKPYLYPAELFDMVDQREPKDWIIEIGEDGERYAYPQPLNTPGFFEDFFDANRQVIATFWHVVNRRLAETMVAM